MAGAAAAPGFYVAEAGLEIMGIEDAIRAARKLARQSGARQQIVLENGTAEVATVWPDGQVDAGWGGYVTTTQAR